MSEIDGVGAIPPTPEGDQARAESDPLPQGEREAPQRRPRRRRRSPARPPAEAVVPGVPEEPVVGQRPQFWPLDSEPAAPTAAEPAQAELPGLHTADRTDARASRRPRRRRPPADTPATPAEGASPESTEPQEPAEGIERSLALSEPAAPARGRSRRAPASTLDVNVVVPRGLGRRVNSKLIQQVVQLAVQREGWEQPASLDVVIVSDEEMREINVTRRGIDEATDVLSFPMIELRPESGVAEDFFVLPPETQVHLGDVVISFARVESQADEAGHSRERELAFLTVHAVLHILGYDHDTEDKRRRMRRREEEVLVELGLRRNGA